MNIVPSADKIELVAVGFMASKVLFTAIEFVLFTELAKGSLKAEEIQLRMGLHPSGVRDFLDPLVALGMLERQREFYSNAADADFFLDRQADVHRYVFRFMERSRIFSLGAAEWWPQIRQTSERDRTRRRRLGRGNVRDAGAIACVLACNDRAQSPFGQGELHAKVSRNNYLKTPRIGDFRAKVTLAIRFRGFLLHIFPGLLQLSHHRAALVAPGDHLEQEVGLSTALGVMDTKHERPRLA